MRKIISIMFSILFFNSVFGQMDFEKMRQEYVSRKPALDSMYAYPDVPYDSLRVNNEDGTSISFWWLPHEKGRGTALLVHGFQMNKSHMISRAKIYYDLGYNLLLMDLRARGQSGGTTTSSGPEIRSDLIAVMAYYEQHFKEYGPLVLVGYSHGARAVVFAAEQKPEMVKGIVLESMPYSLSNSFRRIYKMDPPPIPEGNISNALSALSKIPILLMVGSEDQAIIPEEAFEIKSFFGTPKSQLVMFDKGGHDLSLDKFRTLYTGSIKSFCETVIK